MSNGEIYKQLERLAAEDAHNKREGKKTVINEKKLIMDLVKHDGHLLGYGSEKLQNDPEVAYQAVKQTDTAAMHIGKYLKQEIGTKSPLKHLEGMLQDSPKKEAAKVVVKTLVGI